MKGQPDLGQGAPADDQPVELVVVGRVVKAVGVRGEMKVSLESSDPQRLTGVKRVWVGGAAHSAAYEVSRVRVVGGKVRLSLEGVRTPEEADLLAGCNILLDQADRPELGEGEYYDDTVIGCEAVSDQGMNLGMVSAIIHQGHHDLWELNGPLGDILVPAVKEYVLDVNLAQKRVVIRHREGLW